MLTRPSDTQMVALGEAIVLRPARSVDVIRSPVSILPLDSGAAEDIPYGDRGRIHCAQSVVRPRLRPREPAQGRPHWEPQRAPQRQCVRHLLPGALALCRDLRAPVEGRGIPAGNCSPALLPP